MIQIVAHSRNKKSEYLKIVKILFHISNLSKETTNCLRNHGRLNGCMTSVNIIQGGPIKIALLRQVYFALLLDYLMFYFFHFDSDIEVHYISVLYRTIFCKFFSKYLQSILTIWAWICIITTVRCTVFYLTTCTFRQEICSNWFQFLTWLIITVQNERTIMRIIPQRFTMQKTSSSANAEIQHDVRSINFSGV